MNRHKENHKLWSPTSASSAAFADLPGSGWYVFTAELMHSKVPGLRDTNYVHDILVADGEHLVGKTFVERQSLLHDLFDVANCDKTITHYIVDDNTWIARNYTTGFDRLFGSLTDIQDEGLVLKRTTAKLKVSLRASTNSDWQLKCRKPHKNYMF